jgi:hypothetical protein
MNRHQGTELVQDAHTTLSCYKQHQFIQQDPEDTIEGSLNPASISGYTGIVLCGHRDCLFSRIKWHAEKHQRYSGSPFTCSQGIPAACAYLCWAGIRNCPDPWWVSGWFLRFITIVLKKLNSQF